MKDLHLEEVFVLICHCTSILKKSVHKGALVCVYAYVGNDVYGPQQAHVYGQDELKGVQHNPLWASGIGLSTLSVHNGYQ